MKNNFIAYLSFSLIAINLLSVDSVKAENDGGEYQSNSSIGFHGEYVFPEEVKPPIVIPKPDPEKEKPVIVEPNPNPGDNSSLPQTGVKQAYLSELGGLALIGYYLIQKLKIKKENKK